MFRLGRGLSNLQLRSQLRSAAGRSQPPTLPPSHPMAKFNTLLTSNQGAAALYRELLTCITSGDAEASKEIAALLAQHAQKLNERTAALVEGAEVPVPPSSRPPNLEDAVPFSDDSILHAAEKLQSSEGGPVFDSIVDPLMEQSDALRIIIIDSNFELEEDDNEDGKASTDQLAVLDEYLRTDDGRWKEQKRAVSQRVLEAAREAGVTPALLVASPSSNAGRGRTDGSMSPFKECNVVVRCEVPPKTSDAEAAAAIESKLRDLRESADGEWSGEADALARREMELSLESVRYKVGVHYSLEHALGREMCAAFVEKAMAKLNESNDDVLSRPVMPFTFLLRTCLWFDLDEATSTSAAAPV